MMVIPEIKDLLKRNLFMPFSPIKSANVSEEAANQIRELIAIDVLKPDDALPGERELGDLMGISRTSIRTALQVLTTEGLLISKRGAGLRVAKQLGASISNPLVKLFDSVSKTSDDFLKFRIILECANAYEVAKNSSELEREEINRTHQLLLLAIDNKNLESAAQADIEFHMAITETSANVVSIQVARSLYELMEKGVKRSHKLSQENVETWQTLAKQHEAINQAIMQQDPDGAELAMRQHLEYQRQLSTEYFEIKARHEIVDKRRVWAARFKSD